MGWRLLERVGVKVGNDDRKEGWVITGPCVLGDFSSLCNFTLFLIDLLRLTLLSA